MNNIKLKCYILGGIFSLCLLLFLTRVTGAKAATSTTFPVDEAGIAAYVKLDSVDISDLTEALNFYHSIEKQEETYIIGTMEVANESPKGGQWSNYPHLYIGLDGWVVAYYLNTEGASRIMQWKGYTPGAISTTTLEDAIDIMSAHIGVTYSTLIKYYDFRFPEANKLTLIAETVVTGSNCFSVTIPGTLYEGSYSTYMEYSCGYPVSYNLPIIISIDGIGVFQSPNYCKFHWFYGFFDTTTQLEINIPHSVCIERSYVSSAIGHGGGAATVLIYKVE